MSNSKTASLAAEAAPHYDTRVSPWIEIDGAICRVRLLGSIHELKDRVAFIEKTPRVRIRQYGLPYRDEPEARDKDFLNWCEGLKGEGPNDKASQAWCDEMLRTLGYAVDDGWRD